jgi:ornithine--oxo-acid transaminase
MNNSNYYIELEKKYGASNYKPLPVVIAKAKGVWVYDPEGRRYLDCLSAYSAVNQGHCHPRIISALNDQANLLTLTSRAFFNNRLGLLLEKLSKITNLEVTLPMNTGAEAVETAIKIARRWGYKKKNIKPDKAEIIVCDNNFHGRTTTIISFSSDEDSRDGFGPFTPGFKSIPFNDLDSLEKAINENTVAFLVEPIQGEAGIIIPDKGYLKQALQICKKHNVLFIADEIQTGLGRTGKMFCCQHEDITPDMYIVGKALGGGVLPISAAITRHEIMDIITPGCHGSTFGGNPLACAVAITALDVLIEENLSERSHQLGEYFLSQVKNINSPLFSTVRGKGLFVAIELKKSAGLARQYTEKMMKLGLLAKETHDYIIRLAPPLVITKDEIDWALSVLKQVF